MGDNSSRSCGGLPWNLRLDGDWVCYGLGLQVQIFHCYHAKSLASNETTNRHAYTDRCAEGSAQIDAPRNWRAGHTTMLLRTWDGVGELDEREGNFRLSTTVVRQRYSILWCETRCRIQLCKLIEVQDFTVWLNPYVPLPSQTSPYLTNLRPLQGHLRRS